MDREFTLVEHLSELRKRIIVSLIWVGIAAASSFPLAESILRILKEPAYDLIDTLVFFSPQEAFLIHLRISFFSGLVMAMPVILYELWAFLSPALEDRFRKSSSIFIISSFASFITGGLFAYNILLRPAMNFLLGFASDSLEPVISASKYIEFVIAIIVGCGIVFQMPVLSFILTRIGVVNARMLRKKYTYAIVVIFIAAAVITPTADIFNMLLLAIPMVVLYEASIWVSFFARRGPKQIKQIKKIEK